MTDNDYTVLNIDSLSDAYAGTPDLAGALAVALEALFTFMENEGLLLCRVTDDRGRIVKRHIMASELTDEGDQLSNGPRNAVHRWLGSKGVTKSPPDLKILKKELAKMREKK